MVRIMGNILFIMGQPNVGKTSLIKKLLETGNFTLPIHCTNRPPRKDDDGFYKYVDESFFTEKNMYIWACDSYGRYYGVQHFIPFNDDTYIVNCSIKSLSQVIMKKKICGDSVKVCILLSRNPIIKIKESNQKYSIEEAKYRIEEMKSELDLLHEYIVEIKDYIFYVEDYSNFDELIKDIES